MPKLIDTKKKEETVPATTTVVLPTVAAEPVAEKKAQDKIAKPRLVAPRGKKVEDPTPEELEQAARTKADVATLEGLELTDIRNVLLQEYYSFGRRDDGEEHAASSSLVVNGEKIEPLVAGVKRNFASLVNGFRTRFSSFSRRRGRGRPYLNSDNPDADIETFDLYVYKVKRPSANPYIGSNATPLAEVDALTKKMNSEFFYQILVLAAGTTVTITADFKEPSPYNHKGNIWSGAYGILVARESQITNCLFFGRNTVNNAELNDTTMFDSSVHNAFDLRSFLSNADLENSVLDGTSIRLSGRTNWQRAKIRSADLLDVRYSGDTCVINKSRLTDFSTGGRSLHVSNSRVTNVSLSSKDEVIIRNTALHHDESYHYSTGDSIVLNSVFDVMVQRFTNGSSIYLIRGSKNFWVGATGNDSCEAAMEIFPVSDTETPFRFGRYNGHSNGNDCSVHGFLTRVIAGELGKSELTDSIITTVSRQITDRIAIAASIATANKIRESNEGYVF